MISVFLMDLFLLVWEVNNTDYSVIKKYLGAYSFDGFATSRFK